MKIEFGFAYSKNRFPWNIGAVLINLFQKIDASHFYMAYYSESGNKKYLDSTMFTVRDRGSEVFFKEYELRKSWYTVLQVERKEFIKWLESYEGKGYGFLQIVGLAFMILRFATKNIYKSGSNRVICNELGLLFFQDFLDVELSKSSDDYDLDDTYNVVVELENESKVFKGEI